MCKREKCEVKYLVLGEKKDQQPRILYHVKLPFKSEREIKTFSDKLNLREFVAIRTALQKC